MLRRSARAMTGKIPKQSQSVLGCKFGVTDTRALTPSAHNSNPPIFRHRKFRQDQAGRPGVENFKRLFTFARDRRLITARSEAAAQDTCDRRFVINDQNLLRSVHHASNPVNLSVTDRYGESGAWADAARAALHPNAPAVRFDDAARNV
jgi:hypothetical protein